MYRYQVHGLTLDSELELPELLPGHGTPDITIRFGSVPDALPGTVSRGACYQAIAGQCVITLPRVARYWVNGPSEVVIERAAGSRDEDVRVFVLSSVMGALAHQRGLLALHASAIEIDGRGVLFAGESGAGKSTLTAAFHDRGCRIVTDDLSILTFDDGGRARVQPGYRHVKLWSDSLGAVGASLGARRPLRVGMPKFSVAVPGEGPSGPLPLDVIFLLTTKLSDGIAIEPVTGSAKLKVLLRETYRRRMSVALGHREAHFAQCSTLAARVRMVRLHRPFALDGMDALMDAIEREVRRPSTAPS